MNVFDLNISDAASYKEASLKTIEKGIK